MIVFDTVIICNYLFNEDHVIITMRQHSDDEEGFIASDFQIRNKHVTKMATISTQKDSGNGKFVVSYRFASSFIKKEHPRALNTPLTVPTEPLTAVATVKKHKGFTHFNHPFKVYCSGTDFSLLYSRTARQPFTHQRQYLKNEVSLLNMDDKTNPSLKQLKPYSEQQYSFNGDDLHFDSRFQNGNLHCAFRKKGTNQYHLFMSNDTNTLGYNQWFYFSVRNMSKKVKYTFHVVNYRKCLEFWRQGQRIAMFSLKEAEQKGSGWQRVGNKLSVEQSNIRSCPQRKQFVLSFELQFQHENDYILLASSIPYSYSKLIKELRELQQEANKTNNVKWQIKSVATTLCNNQVPEITITGRESNKAERDKRVIVVMARQHPGQVWSSFVAQGVMRSMLKNNAENQYLLENYIVKIYPMVNVDGVIYGNFRCDVTGVDLNRRWREPSRLFHPQIFDLKKKITTLNKKFKVDLCLDLHGHSKKYNIFCYACKNNSYTCRILPLLIKNQTPLFYFPSCTFGLSRDKESTARAAISRILKSQNVLTIEASTFGSRVNLTPVHFNPKDLYKFGEVMMKAVRYFVDKKCSKYKAGQKSIKQNFAVYKQYDNENQEESGSDSEPEQDEIDFKIKMATIIDKKFQNEIKSFLKEDNTAQLHLSQIIFKDDPNDKKNDDLHKSKYNNQQTLNFEGSLNKRLSHQKSQKQMDMLQKQRNDSPTLEHKKSMSINYAQIGRDVNISEIAKHNVDNKKMFITKNIFVRQKKKKDVEQNQRESVTLNPRDSIRVDVGRSNVFKQLYKEDQKKRMDGFLSKFQKFIPSNLNQKNRYAAKNRFDMLQQSLNKDDPTCQLNMMLQNKRKVELQRIKKHIQDTTVIAERQGKIRITSRKDPVIDFKKFKQNQKAKQMQKRLGQFSQRYIDGRH